MRKNKVYGKNLGVYYRYKITGLNQNRLIEKLSKNNVTSYNIFKKSRKEMLLSVKYCDREKLFAITRELCYNIKEVKAFGLAYPVLYLAKNVGVLIGAILFIITTCVLDGYIFSIDYSGTGRVLYREVENYLNGIGVKKFTRFSDINLRTLADGILANNPNVNYCQCVKIGKRLNIELALKNQTVPTLTGKEEQILSPVNGVIESIKVYRGTALKNVGDTVLFNEVIVDGVMTVKEETVKTYAIASITIRAEFLYEYRSSKDGEEEKALLLALEELGEREILSPQVIKTVTKKENIYRVRVPYRVSLVKG